VSAPTTTRPAATTGRGGVRRWHLVAAGLVLAVGAYLSLAVGASEFGLAELLSPSEDQLRILTISWRSCSPGPRCPSPA
jgi:hypothetical protein